MRRLRLLGVAALLCVGVTSVANANIYETFQLNGVLYGGLFGGRDYAY